MDKYQFTVVTITFNLLKANRAELFRRAFDSVHTQNGVSIEHIIYDGASSDGTVALIQKIIQGYDNVRFITEPDHGIYDAMNKAVRIAQGKYVAFLNSDDYWHDPDGLKETLYCLEKYKADFAYSTCYFESEQSQRLGVLNPVPGAFLFRNPFCHQTMFTTRKLMLKVGLFDDKRFKSAADFDLIMRIFLAGAKGIQVQRNFTTYRQGGLSDKNQENSIREVCMAIYKNIHPQVPSLTENDCYDMWHKLKVPKAVVDYALTQLSMVFRQDLMFSLLTARRNAGYYKFARYPELNCSGNLLLGPASQIPEVRLTPFSKIKQILKMILPKVVYAGLQKICNNLFAVGPNWIDTKLMFFFMIPIFCIRRNYTGDILRFYLFGILLFSKKRK